MGLKIVWIGSANIGTDYDAGFGLGLNGADAWYQDKARQHADKPDVGALLLGTS